MRHTRGAITEHRTERLSWEVARRDETRMARRLYRKQDVDGVYRPDEGALLDDFWHFLRALGVMDLLADVHSAAIQRERVPFVHCILRYGPKTWFGIERLSALPSLLSSDEALMQLMGFNAPQGRGGVSMGLASDHAKAAPRIPLTVKVGKIGEHESHWTLVLVTQAQATAGEETTLGRRVHTVRHGKGSPAGTERLET